MSEYPRSVADALERALSGGKVDLQDRDGIVIHMALNGDWDAIEWIDNNAGTVYVAALARLGITRKDTPG